MKSLTRALAYADGTHTEADIAAGVAAGAFQRWDGDHSTIITEIRQTPRLRFLHFFLAEGEMAELRAMVPPILDWGRMHGCEKAQLIGRHGWQRVDWLVAAGWTPSATVMEVRL
jgi:hypothetical protein